MGFGVYVWWQTETSKVGVTQSMRVERVGSTWISLNYLAGGKCRCTVRVGQEEVYFWCSVFGGAGQHNAYIQWRIMIIHLLVVDGSGYVHRE